MKDLKLYSEGLPDIGGSPTLDQLATEIRDHLDWLLEVGGLVEVEPDYEAAAQIYATDYDNDWETMSKGDRDFAIASVKEYVAAALEGSNDE